MKKHTKRPLFNATLGVPEDGLTLRQKAEVQLLAAQQKSSDTFGNPSIKDTEILLHNLQVHQIELELQNEEIRRAKDVLDVSRARYVELYDLAPVGYCTVGENGLIVQANLTLATLLGVTRKTLLQQPFSKLVIREDQDIWYRLSVQSLISNTPQTCELRMRMNQGPASIGDDAAFVWAQLTITLSQDDTGNTVRYIAVSDISMRKQNESKLLLAASVFSNAREGILITDVQGTITDVNQSFCRITGYSREQVIGQNPRILKSGRQDQVFYEAMWHDLAEQRHWSGEVWNRRKDGELFAVQMTISVVPEELGQACHFVGIFSDITARKENEALLLEARNQAEAANLAKSRFLSTMSHEIRTPMNGILGMAQLLLQPGLQEDTHDDYIHTILSCGQTLLALLNDVLDLSKIEAGKLQLGSTVFSPKALIHETCNLFAGSAKAKGLQIGCQWWGSSDQHYQADSPRLRQMLSNLVGNAIKFTHQGQIHVVATEIEHTGESHLLEFSVSDSGIGIPADKLGLLFKPFSQVDSSNTREFAGSGLGLSIVRNLALAMGGDVGVSSEPGLGSRFWFRVLARSPIKVQENRLSESLVAETNHARVASMLCGHVLVADDNLVNCLLINALLGQYGLNIEQVHDGQQAVDTIKKNQSAEPFDLIFMDLHMPVLDGYSATEKIRQWEMANKLQHLPIIALTADAFEEDRQHCFAVGMNDFLTKPIYIEALKRVLIKWLKSAPMELQ